MRKPPRSPATSRRRPAARIPAAAAPSAHDSASPHPWVQLRSATYHPFIFRRMIGAADPNARPGDVVSVYDKGGRPFGVGFYNPASQITLRILSHDGSRLPDDFWSQRLQAAVRLRHQTLRLDEQTDAYRLVHAEADGLSGLIVDRYADHLAVEIFSLGMFRQLDSILPHLQTALGSPTGGDHPADWKVVVRADPHVEQMEGFHLPPAAETAPPLTIREHGLRFRVDLARGHKTGFFCDQRDNRRALAALCRDAALLDVCCYTGGFALHARVNGKAREVTAVDLDENALALARENANLNQARIQFTHADAFPFLRQLIANGRQFDVVVLDPPKLIASREEFAEGRQRYLDLNKLVLALVRPGGVLLTCSCSGLLSPDAFMDMLRYAARIAGRRLVQFNFTAAAPDHPVALECPESAYLKAAWLNVR